MQFSQVAERGERQHGNQGHIILSRDNGITKFRFSVCSALSIFIDIYPHAQRDHLAAVENGGCCCASSFQARKFGSEAIRPVTTAREPDEMNSSARNEVRPQV
jgi:hypothetical protein